MVLSGLTLAPAPHAPGHRAPQVERAVTTPGVGGRDTVKIRDDTSFPIDVQLILLVPGFPTIVGDVSKQRLQTFSFRSNTNGFIEMTVRPPSFRSQPSPFTTILDKPDTGYNGETFVVTVIAGRFQVRP
jgi:hypothetical protein